MNYFSNGQDIMWKYPYDNLEIILMLIGVALFLYYLFNYSRVKVNRYLILSLSSLTLVFLVAFIFYVQFILPHNFQEIDVDDMVYRVHKKEESESIMLDTKTSIIVNDILNNGSFKISFNNTEPYVSNEDVLTLEIYNRDFEEHFFIVLDDNGLIMAYKPDRNRRLELDIDEKELYKVMIDSK